MFLENLIKIFFLMKNEKKWNFDFGNFVFRFWDLLKKNSRFLQILRFVSKSSRFFRFSVFQIFFKHFKIFSDFQIFRNFQFCLRFSDFRFVWKFLYVIRIYAHGNKIRKLRWYFSVLNNPAMKHIKQHMMWNGSIPINIFFNIKANNEWFLMIIKLRYDNDINCWNSLLVILYIFFGALYKILLPHISKIVYFFSQILSSVQIKLTDKSIKPEGMNILSYNVYLLSSWSASCPFLYNSCLLKAPTGSIKSPMNCIENTKNPSIIFNRFINDSLT